MRIDRDTVNIILVTVSILGLTIAGTTLQAKADNIHINVVEGGTQITDSYTQDGQYYIKDSKGNIFHTGEVNTNTIYDDTTIRGLIQANTDAINNIPTVDLTPIEQNINGQQVQIDENKGKIENNTKAIEDNRTTIKSLANTVNNNNQNVQAIQQGLADTNHRIDKLQDKMNKGFATVTALTGLHPNPRANTKLEVAVSGGIYEDTAAGAAGLFYHPNDRVQLNAGVSYGGDDSFAGNVGVTFSIGRRK